MRIKEKRKAGELLGRDGISERIISLAVDIASGSYKNAIERAGQISVLVDSATYDEYWQEKSESGKRREADILSVMVDGGFDKEVVRKVVNPYACQGNKE